jgi:outer membrane receptor for ferrienterochelin and colicins
MKRYKFKSFQFLTNSLAMLAALVFFIVIPSENLLAEMHNVSGTITDESGNPVPGATIKVENTVLGTIADREGNFVLKKVPHGEFTILVTSVGKEPEKVKINLEGNATHNVTMDEIVMKESAVISDNVVVTATRNEKVYEDVPVKVSVVSSQLFEATSSVSLHDGLSFQPGLRVEDNCQNCGFSQVRLNGLEGQYTQILIDSRPIYSSLNGVYGLEQLPANMIDRVEVIRGGASAMYGGNAIGGVVNIITRDPSANTFSAGVNQAYINGFAPDRNLNLNGSLVSMDQDMGFSFYGNYRDRAHWDANGDGFSEIGELSLKTFGGRLFYTPDHTSRINLTFNTISDERRGGNQFHLEPHQTDITEMAGHEIYNGDISFEKYFSKINLQTAVYASYQSTIRDSYYGAEQDLNAYGNTENQTLATGIQLSKIINDFAGGHIITAGYEFRSDNLVDRALAYDRIIDQETNEHGFYIQDDWMPVNNLTIVAGTRIDKHNLIDNVIFSPRANLMYKITEKTSARLNFATGFRAPQAFDEDLHITQVGGEGFVIRVGENLKEERSMSYGLSLDHSFKIGKMPFAVSAEYFNTKLDDAFALEPAGTDANDNLIYERVNSDGATVNGITLELQTIFSRFDLKTGVTYENAHYEAPQNWSDDESLPAEEKLLRTPDFYGYFAGNIRATDKLTLSLSGKLTGPMLIPHYAGYIENDELKETDTFFELDAKISYMLFENPGLELSIGAQNILNSYQDDFDMGISRDAGYIYGPTRPYTVYMGIKTSL